MFTRIKELVKKIVSDKPRQLIVASLFLVYGILLDTNLGLHAAGLSPLNLGLLITGATLMSLAIVHSFGRSVHAVAHINDADEQQNVVQEAPQQQPQAAPQQRFLSRPSTHNFVNAALLAVSSVSFTIVDGRIVSGEIPVPANSSMTGIICRLVGLELWLLAALIGVFHALAHDRRQENHPDEQIRALGLHPATYNLSIEVLYFAAVLFFAEQNDTEVPYNPLRVNNALWIIAAVIGTSAALYGFITRNRNENADNEPQVVVLPDEPAPALEVVAAARAQEPALADEVVIEVDLEESVSSEVVVARPGTF